jgi:hypothetical protein
MALNGSGAISLAGTTVGQSIACELGCSGTGQIDINRADVRTLAAVASGQISFSSFYGKSNVPPAPTTLGQVYNGGYYTGVINAGVGCYYVSVAPNASGCASCCIWKTGRTTTADTNSLVNGYSNTWGPMNNATHPAGNFCATRSIGGFADWYLPASDELKTMYVNKGSMPAGEQFCVCAHWSSTQRGGGDACTIRFSDGNATIFTKTARDTSCPFVRAVRRSPI